MNHSKRKFCVLGATSFGGRSVIESLLAEGHSVLGVGRRNFPSEPFVIASQKLQKYAQDKNQEILQSLAPAYEKVLNEIIEIDQIDLILSPTALTYANKKHDITKKVTERLNADKD